MTIYEWQDAPSVERIQDTNYLANDIIEAYKRYNANKGCVLTDAIYQRGIAQLIAIDNQLRIPARWRRYRVEQVGIGDGSVQLGQSPIVDGQNMAARCTSRLTTASDSEILDYVPRMYAELSTVKDFVTNVLTPAGCTKHYNNALTFAPYDLGLKSGMLYDDITDTGFSSREDLYVLTGIGIYTNKTDGTNQTLLGNYTYSDSGTYMQVYDTFVPFNTTSNNNTSGSTGSLYIGKKWYYPYMQNMLARVIPWTGAITTTLSTPHTAYCVGGLEMKRAGDTLIGGYLNRITSMATGDITNNPFWAQTNTAADREKWGLTSEPTGRKYTYIVCDRATWRKVLNGSGMPWSFDLDDVIKPDDGDLNKPTKPGQPTNPTDDDDGDGDNISDDIPLPDVPFAPNNNAYNRYWVTPSKLPELQSWIFSETFLNDIKRLWNDPADYLINISLYPFDGALHDVDGVAESTIAIGNLSSDIPAKSMLDNYSAKFYGGTLSVTNYYNSYLDYAPYTSAEIYIPYIGYKPININDVMGRTLELLYFVDWDNNILTATLMVDDRPLTMYSGSFGVKLALSGNNANQIAETITQAAASIIMSGGMAATHAAAGETSRAIKAGIEGLGTAIDTAIGIQYMPRQFGTPTPATGLYNTQVPHLIIHRPIMAEPTDYKALHGYAAAYSGTVSEFSGYLQCSQVDIKPTGTMSQEECNEIITLLTGGIFI